ncbi:MAG TPA: hypothetical protein VNM92_07870 [Thermoanaerobaculia bacterium]|nr:hypothetical protein [Thermoanaerobaculia bacterium]
MKTRNLSNRSSKSHERGSALLVSLMVIVGLSLLGLGFVAISETESAISVNQRNGLQAQAAASAGARLVVEWFQNPTWARTHDLMPANIASAPYKTTRVLGGNTGVYKTDVSILLFDKPYKPNNTDRFFGSEESADLIFNATTSPTQINNINTKLFGSTTAEVRISEIRIYAPPISGGTLTGGFWIGGTRYGVATIKATAERYNPNGTAVASRSVRIAVGEFPLPVPGGPIQSKTGINLGGNFNVWWGSETSEATLDDDRSGVSTFPWQNAYERPHFERGYEYPDQGANNVWPLVPGSTYDARNYFNPVRGLSMIDPWFGQRSVGLNTSNCSTPVPPGYLCGSYTADSVTQTSPTFVAFQRQAINNYPDRQVPVFPDIKYDFWKRIAQQGRGTVGLYYFTYDTATTKFRLNGAGAARHAADWVNTVGDGAIGNGARLGAGLYFFDTRTGQNPQNANGTTNTAILTPSLSWNSNDFGSPNFLMQGFVYLNAARWGTTGSGNSAPNLLYNMPGEIYRDIGYRKWDTSTSAWAVDATGAFITEGGNNGGFDSQDMNGNGRQDVVTVSAAGVFRPKTWAAGCTIPAASYDGTNAAANDCSEPHEPYMNFIYPTATNTNVVSGWEAGLGTQRRKIRGVTCSASVPGNCTSNAHDDIGGMVPIPADSDGVVYNEGAYDPQGNARMYGSLLFKGAVDGTGTPFIYFDEKLLKGTYAPPGFPRVIIFSEQTDEQQ